MKFTEEEWKLLKEVMRALTFGKDAALPLRELVESVDKRLGNNSQPSLSIPVYWKMCGDDTIYQSNAVRVVDDGIEVRCEFDDGGWNPIESCFLTEEQCRSHHKLPPQEWVDSRESVKKKLQDLIEEL